MEVSAVDKPDTSAKNDFYISNRAPLLPSPLIKLPVGKVRPKGWIEKQLRLQADGFHGHLTEISEWLVKEDNAWLSKEGVGQRGWEEVPYWLKGFSNTAYLLGDERMLEETQIWIEGALNSQKADGWFGPDEGRGGRATRLQGREDLWPNMIMLFCLQDYYEYTGDSRVIDLMTKYFRYLEEVPEDRFLVGYWPKMRGGDLLFSVYWLYNITGEEWLLPLAEKVHRTTAPWVEDVINWHNVNMSQGFGEPGTYYMQSKDPAHLAAAERNWQTMRRTYGQMPGGMFAGDENCRPGYTDPRQAVETCGMVEMMLSHETLLRISGDLVWADRCEDVTFNSLPASTTPDMGGLRYLTGVNMALSDRHSKSPGLQNGGAMLLFNPHQHRCCQHNMGHGWPYYAENLWLATPDNGLAAVLYGPSEVTAKVGDGTEVKLVETTHYPFDEAVRIEVKAPRDVRFPVYLRAPQWCEKPRVKVNGRGVKTDAGPRQLIRIERTWSDGDVIDVTLPMEVSLRTWTENKDSVSVDRGPLTYSLKIGENYVRQGGTDTWPAYEIHPTTPWNYGLVLEGGEPAAAFEVVKKDWPASDEPWRPENAPIAIKAKARQIPQWRLDRFGLVAPLQPSPTYSDEPVETVTLIPMGAARIRIAAFPVVSDRDDAHRWSPPPPQPPKMASHVWGTDTVEAISDGRIPSHSGDDSIPRFTWWDHRGTTEWVQYNLKEPRTVRSAQVYWFDDTGRGRCRVPASWRLLYRDGEQWKEVSNASGYGVEKDRFNKVTFEPIKTDALRVEAKLRSDVSGGVLEMRVD